MIRWCNEDDRRRYYELVKKSDTSKLSEKKRDFIRNIHLEEEFKAYGEV